MGRQHLVEHRPEADEAAARVTVRQGEANRLVETVTEARYAIAIARIENHYMINRGWFDDGQLIRDAGRLKAIPGVIVQGRYDACTPAVTAWDLHRAWPEAELHIVPDAGHAFNEPGILHRLIEATDRFAAEEALVDA